MTSQIPVHQVRGLPIGVRFEGGRPRAILGIAGGVGLLGLLLLAVAPLQARESQSLPELRKQLEAAEQADDNPAIAELCYRIVKIDPGDSDTWETLARKQVDDPLRCARTLDAWEKSVHPRSQAIDDIRGDLANARQDYKTAERYWRLYVAANPEATETLEKLAKLAETGRHWEEAATLRTRILAHQQTGPGLVARANDYLEMRAWDKASADYGKAATLDPTDSVVKDSLPRFERLKKLLPQIRSLDARIATGMPLPLLDRARLLTLSGYPNLALEDCEVATNLAPGMMRARIQKGEALLDLGRIRDAANLGISHDLQHDKNNHISDDALRSLTLSDEMVLKDPEHAEPRVTRAKTLFELRQYTLALAETELALKLDPGSASACLLAARSLESLGRFREALARLQRASMLDPRDPALWYYRGLLEARRADFEAAILFQSRSLAIRESNEALLEREKCERRTGRIAEAEADAQRRKQLYPSQE